MTNGYVPPPSNTLGKTSLFLGLFASIFMFCTGLCAGIGKEQGWLQRVGLLFFVVGATSAFMGFLAALLGLGGLLARPRSAAVAGFFLGMLTLFLFAVILNAVK